MRKASALGLALIGIAAILSCSCAMPGPTRGFVNDSSPVPQSQENSSPPGKPGASSEARRLQFSGYDWTVKSSSRRVGPGPNYFSDSHDNVTVDPEGKLHLKITQRDGQWYCPEVVSTRSFGYGTYRFYLDTAVDNLDPQVVLGMFTWNDARDYEHREIDIEISRWGRVDNKNGQFVVQPYARSQNIVRFQISTNLSASTHLFTWKPTSVFCQSIKGSATAPPESSSIIQQHTFTEGIPQAGGENARINLWLFGGRVPANNKEAEVIISKFEFVPLQP